MHNQTHNLMRNQNSKPARNQARSTWMALLTVLALLAAAGFGASWIFQRFTDRPTPVAVEEPIEEPPPPEDPEPVTPPLDFTGFNAGNIISDEVFYNAEAMDQAAIEAFLTKTNDGCREGFDGTPCITDFVQETQTIEATDFCYEFPGAPDDTAAAIISKAATACGINPQVLLVMLQKEQGLLTASGMRLTADRYAIAMGYGCPDSAHCAPEYTGFANQVYHAAKQLRMYDNQPEKYRIQPYGENEIAFNPNAECQATTVYVENSATAGLYNYTPYQPDAAALAGTHGACSSFGNLNFYAYFRAWFGPGL